MVDHNSFNDLFSIDNLFSAWLKFRSGKTKKYDVQSFERHLEDNLFSLYETISENRYKHGGYTHFIVHDSKKRDIYKAEVKDRVVHQLVYNYLVDLFEPDFIADSYSSRLGKGSHRAVKTFVYFTKLAGKNCYILKCDIKKYFNNIDHGKLLEFIGEKVKDERTLVIIKKIVESYRSKKEHQCGVPLGNVTSQIFANIYLHQLDLFIKNVLKCRYCIRYNDDFVIIDLNYIRLEKCCRELKVFTKGKLLLEIPESKAVIRKLRWGTDWLGYVVLSNGILLRGKTKTKIFSNIRSNNINSKFAVLKHCNSYNLRQKLICQWNKR